MRSILPSGLLTALLFAPACAPDITVVESYSDPNTPDAPVSPDADNDGFTVEDGDCNDADPEINPDAIEICDGIDNDCSGEPDDVTGNIWYLDMDLDGYGGGTGVVDGCELESTGEGQWTNDSTDCDDTDASVNPSAEEVCNGIDDDCEGTIDENAVDASTWYTDGDSDGYGDASSSTVSCEAPSGTVADSSDCDDHNPLVNPGQEEVCDELDNDCDDDIDEADGNPDVLTVWDDDDADGFGDDDAGSFVACPEDGFALQGGDCDDSDGEINPEADEICDGLDNDCNGSIDPDTALDASTWYTDGDSDGYGNSASPVVACDVPTGTVEDSTDCDDADASVNPSATEVCDDVDNDCDGTIDVGAIDTTTWYPDTDGDSYGNATGVTVDQCDQPESYVADATDCDDTDPDVNPGELDIDCDGVDDNCDGSIDESGIGDASYPDADGDGYGNDSVVASFDCTPPTSYVGNNDDCDDADNDINPDGFEECNGEDDDCDGTVDEGVTNVFYVDNDGDGYGDPASSADACEVSDGYVEDDSDCDDANEYVHPDGIEVCDDTFDNDCDGDADSSPCVSEGSYEGNFVITLTETTYGLGSDNCEGDAYLTVDTTADPMISGYVECAFVGDASAYLTSTYTGTVEGNFDQDIANFGTIDWSTFGWTIDFDGVYDVDHEVNLDFVGDDTYDVYGIPVSFSYEGYVDTDVVP